MTNSINTVGSFQAVKAQFIDKGSEQRGWGRVKLTPQKRKQIGPGAVADNLNAIAKISTPRELNRLFRNNSGTSFTFDPNFLLTAAHVVGEHTDVWLRYKILNFGGESLFTEIKEQHQGDMNNVDIRGKVFATSQKDDLALVALPPNFSHKKPIGLIEQLVNDDVYTLGFGGFMAKNPSMTVGGYIGTTPVDNLEQSSENSSAPQIQARPQQLVTLREKYKRILKDKGKAHFLNGALVTSNSTMEGDSGGLACTRDGKVCGVIGGATYEYHTKLNLLALVNMRSIVLDLGKYYDDLAIFYPVKNRVLPFLQQAGIDVDPLLKDVPILESSNSIYGRYKRMFS